MSYLFDGSDDTLTGSFTSTYSSSPVTLAAFVKVTAHPVAQQTCFAVGNNSASPDAAQSLRTGATDNVWDANSRTTSGQAASVTLDLDGLWAGWVGVFTNASLRDVYRQTISSTGQNTGTRNVANALQFLRVGSIFDATQFFAGRIAAVAMWDIALDSTQITNYLGATSAAAIAAIASSDLLGFWPLETDNATQANEGVDAGGDLTVAGATFSTDHPWSLAAGAAPALYVNTSPLRLG